MMSTQKRSYFLPLYSALLTFLLFAGLILQSPGVSANAIPGGNISDPVVRAVDIAKPAVVRIITTLSGRLTVYFDENNSETFPRNGKDYDIKLSGSGVFISSHGDILTATHVIEPAKDQAMDDYLKMIAAEDVAEYFNEKFQPRVDYTKEEMYSYLTYGIFRSETKYEEPTSEVYLSKDYTGKQTASNLDGLPQETHVSVDRIKKSSPLDEKDTAIIHVKLEDTPSVQLGDSSAVAQQDELTIIGFPGNGDLGDQRNPNPDSYLTSSVNKIYVSAIKTTSKGAPVIQVGGNIEHGDSGGPALDRHGNVVGIVSFGVDNASLPIGTSFLQASQSAKQLISGLNIDMKPGKFQTAWNNAFKAYASNEEGHWLKAYEGFKQIEREYPNFKAITPFLNYAKLQSQKELAPTSTNWIPLVVGVLFILMIIVLAVFVVLFWLQRRKQQDRATYAAAQNYPNAYTQPYVAHGQVPQSAPVVNAPAYPYQLNQSPTQQTEAYNPPVQQPSVPQTPPLTQEDQLMVHKKETAETMFVPPAPMATTPVTAFEDASENAVEHEQEDTQKRRIIKQTNAAEQKTENAAQPEEKKQYTDSLT